MQISCKTKEVNQSEYALPSQEIQNEMRILISLCFKGKDT